MIITFILNTNGPLLFAIPMLSFFAAKQPYLCKDVDVIVHLEKSVK